ncbi:MAG: polysaccharide deacetylase family protein [Methylovirgula sp.]
MTLFVNPWQVEDGRADVFAALHWLLDQAHKRKVAWRGKSWPLATFRQKDSLRAEIKRILRQHDDPQENYALIEELRQALGVAHLDIPDYLQSLTVARLRALRDAGVDIQNHYWTHLDPAAHTPARFADEWLRAQDWLAENLGVASQFFASPFGDYFPPPDFLAEHKIVCLLLSHSHPGGTLRPWVVNRIAFS